MRAKPDGLTPVALRAKRPLIAPSRPSSSRLGCLKKSFWRRKVGRGRAHDRAPGVSAPLSCKICVFAVSISPDSIALSRGVSHGVFHEDTKERKGLDTSPFGALRLTPYPHPLRFFCFLGKLSQTLRYTLINLCGKLQFRRLKSIKGRLSPSGRTIGELGRLCQSRACARSVLRSLFSVLRGGIRRPSKKACRMEPGFVS